MTAQDIHLLERRLTTLMVEYRTAIQWGELGRAITAREEMGKLVLAQFELIQRALYRYNAPLSEPEEEEEEVGNEAPF